MATEEKEIKIKLSKENFYDLQKKIADTVTNKTSKKQKDIYFDTEKMYITNLNRGLRARFNSGKAEVLEFKSLFFNTLSLSDDPWYIEEIAMPFPLYDKYLKIFTSILNRLDLAVPKLDTNIKYTYLGLRNAMKKIGLTPKIIVEKNRVEYKVDSTTFVFDHIANLGYFLEIETKKESPMQILDSLGIKNYVVIRNGYNDMLMTKVPNYLPNEEKQERFKENPSWNVLPSEVDLVKKYFTK